MWAAATDWCAKGVGRRLEWRRRELLLLAGLSSLPTLEMASGDLSLRWEEASEFRSAPLTVPAQGKAGFTLLDAGQTGITFTNRLELERGLANQILFSGSGVAAGDVDGEGWCDLYVCGLDGANALYRNLGGWRFEDVTERAGVALPEQDSSGAVWSDVDGDGDLDLLVGSFGNGPRLFFNDGSGRFSEKTAEAGLAGRTASTTLTLADIEGDGDLDLYVANYRSETLQDEPGTVFKISTSGGVPRLVSVNGRPVTDPQIRDRYFLDPATMRVLESGEADLLFRNEGGGRFSPVSWTDGTFVDEDGKPSPVPRDWGLTALFRDLNQDGAPDLYVCNDSDSVDRVWLNDGAGRFRAMPRLALRKTCFSSMSVDVADINRDGWDDILVSDMLAWDHAVRHTQMVDRRPLSVIGQFDDRPGYMQNTLFLNRGDGTYAEIAQLSGVDASDWTWVTLFLDVDLDGFPDILFNNGLERSFRDSDARLQIDQRRAGRSLSRDELLRLRRALPPLHTPNRAFRNRGDLTFELAGSDWGFDSRQVSHGMALADLDNDGDLDLVVNCMSAPALVYRNDSPAPRLAVRLKGLPPNTRGIGARILVRDAAGEQSQEMICGGRYLSGDDAMRVFAAGSVTNRLRLEVRWRSGRRSVLAGALPNRIYEVAEAGVPVAPDPPPPPAGTFFQDASQLLQHRHQEEPFDEFQRQPLLCRRFSQLGPGVAWHDLDGNQWEDLLVGGGRGGQLTIFLNQGAGRFVRLNGGELTGTNQLDQAGVLGWSPRPERGSILIAVSSYESGATNLPAVYRYDIVQSGSGLVQTLPGQESSSGPLALADIDQDQDLDLFVGGRILPGRYPEPASSLLFRNQDGRFVLDEENCRRLRQVGLVSGAVWSDLTGDGLPELVLACDWGPVRVFGNRAGTLVDVTGTLGLDRYLGWWNGVTTGDLDNDGRLDIVAANWGRNHKYQRYLTQPLRIYFGDLHQDGTVQFLEAHYEASLNKYVPWQFWDRLSAVLPFVRQDWPSFQAYSQAGAEEILSPHLAQFGLLTVNTLDSVVFLNRGDHFEARSLPVEAQFAPAFGVNVADLDGDGHEDIFLSQNFFCLDHETPRCDAGRGLCLRGDGRGNFTPVPGQRSGILVYGEQRGSALADFDQDGRVDLVAAQNGAETKLYRNVGARPGLRVRLLGPPSNPTGVGTVLRLQFGETGGPAREIHAGSGYWSQDSAVQVLATPRPPSALWLRWPGGRVAVFQIPAGAQEVVADFSGRLGVIRSSQP